MSAWSLLEGMDFGFEIHFELCRWGLGAMRDDCLLLPGSDVLLVLPVLLADGGWLAWGKSVV